MSHGMAKKTKEKKIVALKKNNNRKKKNEQHGNREFSNSGKQAFPLLNAFKYYAVLPDSKPETSPSVTAVRRPCTMLWGYITMWSLYIWPFQIYDTAESYPTLLLIKLYHNFHNSGTIHLFFFPSSVY